MRRMYRRLFIKKLTYNFTKVSIQNWLINYSRTHSEQMKELLNKLHWKTNGQLVQLAGSGKPVDNTGLVGTGWNGKLVDSGWTGLKWKTSGQLVWLEQVGSGKLVDSGWTGLKWKTSGQLVWLEQVGSGKLVDSGWTGWKWKTSGQLVWLNCWEL